MAGSAALERALLATTTGEHSIEWLKITLVPLLVLLIGACLWRCIKKFPAWRKATEGGRSERNEAADSSRSTDNNHAARDLEEGLELSHSIAEMPTTTLANVESTEAATTDSTLTNETTSDIGNGLHY